MSPPRLHTPEVFMPPAPSNPLALIRLNLTQCRALIYSPSEGQATILEAVLEGLGVSACAHQTSVEAAQEALMQGNTDILVAEAGPNGEGIDLVLWMRRVCPAPQRFAIAVLVCGHAKTSLVNYAINCGVNFMMSAPVSPKGFVERLFWTVKTYDTFIESEGYCGPDRRIVAKPPPKALRRATDLLDTAPIEVEPGGVDAEA